MYAIVRPPELLADRDERELEMQMMAQRLSEETRCSFCKTPVQDDYLVCPTCGRRLRSQCTPLRQAARAQLARVPVL